MSEEVGQFKTGSKMRATVHHYENEHDSHQSVITLSYCMNYELWKKTFSEFLKRYDSEKTETDKYVVCVNQQHYPLVGEYDSLKDAEDEFDGQLKSVDDETVYLCKILRKVIKGEDE